jgi:hypothetical protein
MKPGALQAAMLGGLTMGVLSALPVVMVANCCCLWVVGGGVLAVYILHSNHPGAISAGESALTGLMAGLFGVGVWLVVTVLIDLMFGQLLGSFQDRLMQMLHEANLPPEVHAALERFGSDDGGLKWMVLAGEFLLQLVIWPLFAALGGLLAAALLKSDTPPAPQPGSTPELHY